MLKKTIYKMTVLLTVSVFGLAACGPMETELSNGSEISNSSVGEKVYYENSNADTSEIDQEYAEQCDQWERLDDGSFQCVSEDSNLFGQYLFEGLMFATIGAMIGNALYKKNNRIDGTASVKNSNYNNNNSNKHQNSGTTSNNGSTANTANSNNATKNNATVNDNSKGSATTSPGNKSGTPDTNTNVNSSTNTSKNNASSVTGSKSSTSKVQSSSKPKTKQKSYKSNRKSFSSTKKRR